MHLHELTEADYEIGRLAVEDALIELRDDRISLLGRRNGLVVAEFDGRPSSIIRMGMETAMRIAVKAILERRSEMIGREPECGRESDDDPDKIGY